MPYWSIVLAAPFIVAVALFDATHLTSGRLSFWLGVVASSCMFVLWECFVPLEKR